jgi:ATP-dependent Clp protease ATP-binding subunit ClpB
LADAGFDPLFGARPIKRAMQRYLLNPLSKKMLADEINPQSTIWVDVAGDQLVFQNNDRD